MRSSFPAWRSQLGSLGARAVRRSRGRDRARPARAARGTEAAPRGPVRAQPAKRSRWRRVGVRAPQGRRGDRRVATRSVRRARARPPRRRSAPVCGRASRAPAGPRARPRRMPAARAAGLQRSTSARARARRSSARVHRACVQGPGPQRPSVPAEDRGGTCRRRVLRMPLMKRRGARPRSRQPRWGCARHERRALREPAPSLRPFRRTRRRSRLRAPSACRPAP